MVIIIALEMLKQKNYLEFEVSMFYKARTSRKIKTSKRVSDNFIKYT